MFILGADGFQGIQKMDCAYGETSAANVQIHCSKYVIVQLQQSKKKFLAGI